jgi:hypothetical protein
LAELGGIFVQESGELDLEMLDIGLETRNREDDVVIELCFAHLEGSRFVS